MKGAVVTVGDEILIGQIVDTNSAFIAKSLDKIGIAVHEMLSVSDERQHILDTLSQLQDRVDVVIITGGLGPTKDDITKKTLADYFGDTLVRSAEVEAHVIELIERVMKRSASQVNKDQALVPSTATVLHNAVGTAPGMWLEKAQTVFISLPGVPYEMKYLIENEAVPRLKEKFKRPYILHKTILTYGQGESLVAERIEEWEDNLPTFIKLAYLPSPGRVRLRLTARGDNEQVLIDTIKQETDKVAALIGDIIVGYDEDETIEVVLGRLLKERGLSVAAAESCTGGRIAQLFTSVAGASSYFRGGAVTYRTESKTAVLGVPAELIKEHSVVSAEVAEAMARGAKRIYEADYAIATTGNAGPDRGESAAKVGTVFIGMAKPDGTVDVQELDLGQPREKVIERAANKALEMIYKEILKN